MLKCLGKTGDVFDAFPSRQGILFDKMQSLTRPRRLSAVGVMERTYTHTHTLSLFLSRENLEVEGEELVMHEIIKRSENGCTSWVVVIRTISVSVSVSVPQGDDLSYHHPAS